MRKILVATATALFCSVAALPAQQHAMLTIDTLLHVKHPSEAVWSPDSRQIAFLWDERGVQNIFVVPADGSSKPRALTSYTDNETGAPLWGARSDTVYFARDGREGAFMEVGGADFRDVAAVAAYVKTLPYADANRIGIWGLSYGGFFTLLALTDTPTSFACGIDVAGVADYRMYYTDPYKGGWTYGRIRSPEDAPKAYDVASPLSRAANIVRPLLILHGTADVNVPFLESLRLVDTLLKLGKTFDFATYPGEFHYFQRAHVLRDAWTRAERFFDQHLAPGRAAS